jgi:type I restriction enzyme M protein
MLDTDTKRRIDTARDLLVGKLPDPKSQVEQITIALIYKFMDDMDAEAEELGGKRKFFSGEYGKFGWAKLMQPGIGGHELLALYADGIAKMPENPGIPALFRDIFKNAYLPYRDPETLKSFLKVINEFSYDHSERLGDAFEYLLSVLGSQGDAGQFRTPRHIIDFIVEILAPRKEESLLDPACGTAGFLISAYKHILRSNTDAKGHNTLTPQQRGEMAKNFKGYDISPDMVRLSLVNLYLHGFTDPHIFEYDSLTDTARWNEFADVILANPPFMSPKGGIRPHNRFSIQAKRSEVLFVDYIAEHLTPNGRAGIIVPEGIIFQSQNAYKDLRKMLVENSLVAVISLPAGCFNPYSGVKTSILLLDKSLARKTQTIAFFKVENDGYDLGAQRRPIQKNDLPKVREELESYLATLRERKDPSSLTITTGLIVEKDKIVANGDYNLSGDRYQVVTVRNSIYPKVFLKDVAEVRMGETLIKGDLTGQGKPIFSADTSDAPWAFSEPTRLSFGRNTLVIGARGTIGSVKFPNMDSFTCTQTTIAISGDTQKVLTEFLYHWLKTFDFKKITEGVGIPMITVANVNRIEIPLPPLEIQKEIVAEIEGYQKVIIGARAVLDNYRPHIPINPDWPILELKDVTIKITDGAHFTPTYVETGVPFLRVTDITGSDPSKKFIPQNEHEELIKRCKPERGDVLYSKNGTIGIAKLIDWDWEFSIFVSLCLIKPKHEIVDSHYLTCFLNSESAYAQATARSKSGTVTNLHLIDIKTIKIPLPPLAEQKAIVAEIEAEQNLVNANRELITRFEAKIQTTLSRIWGDESSIS